MTLFSKKQAPTEAEVAQWGGFVKQLAADKASEAAPEKPKSMPNAFFLKVARLLWARGELSDAEVARVEDRMRIVRGKSHSGVLVITVFTSPTPTYIDPATGETKTQRFSCKWNCDYCPNQPGQPRSYLEREPGVLRANRYGFDCVAQMIGRMEDLYDMGHAVDKLEVLVLGGTWESYPEAYRESFIRDIYYAANTFELRGRERGAMEDERDANRESRVKIIGITIETRPDTITDATLATLRRYGCTRVQIGIQHLDDGILKKIHRGCLRRDVVAAIARLKAWGFKIDGHFMPNLPGATPALDRWMLVEQLLGCGEIGSRAMPEALQGTVADWTVWPVHHPEVQLDQWKVYPCETTPYTKIEKWFREGSYVPYPETDLVPVLLDMKAAVFPWIRLNRIVRDIPTDYILASGDHPNLRQDLGIALKKRGQVCRCIRCREVKGAAFSVGDTDTVFRIRESGNTQFGLELFIACEHRVKQTLYGFVRLRLPAANEPSPHPSFENHAWVRELHVYGRLQKTTRDRGDKYAENSAQHHGIGKQLMHLAETLAFQVYSKKMLLVIAGEGTKGYYHRLGYKETVHGYMGKSCVAGNEAQT